MDLAQQKDQARQAAKTKRRGLQNPAAAIEVIGHFPVTRFKGAVIGGFWPLPGELDIRPILSALQEQGHKLALPCTPPMGQPLTFRHWKPTHQLKSGPYDTKEPFPEQPEIWPNLVLVPLLAFTPDGYRLGYGGGFYDRTLAGLRERGEIFACGVAYAGQEVSSVPTDQYDQRLDGILTEAYFKDFS